ncbi:MAG: TIM barrel protein [Anaerolineae bacterium]|nr:TIM barrel protein [Anaerolineae bacterium]MDW8098025.1 TIM barrel protein [Anaerolineae bacterium]
MPRFSVCMPALFPRVPLEESLHTIKELGFDAWETWGLDLQQVEAIRKLNEKLGLTLAQFVGHTSLSDGLNKAENHKRIAEELTQTIRAAKALGCPGLICFSGNTLAGVSEEQQIETIVAGLRLVAPMAEDAGVNLNLELLNSKVDHAGYFNDTSRIGLEIVRRVGSPRVKLLYDIYHMQIMEGNLIATITQNIAHIGHFHAAGVPGRHDMDDTQEINYHAVFRAIDRAGYELFVGLEYWPTGDVIESLRSFRKMYS